MISDPQQRVAAVDNHRAGDLALGGVALVSSYADFIGAAFHQPAYLAMAATCIVGGIVLALTVRSYATPRPKTNS